MTWTIQGKATIVDDDRIVAVCDTQSDAEFIVTAVEEYNARFKNHIWADRELKVGGTE